MRGALLNGSSDMLVTHCLISTSSQRYRLSISHMDDDTPRLSLVMNFDRPAPYALYVGSEKAFIHHWWGQITRLDYSWNHSVANFEVSAPSSCVCGLSMYDTQYDQSYPPTADEETGWIIHDAKHTILVLDTALTPNYLLSGSRRLPFDIDMAQNLRDLGILYVTQL